MTSRVTERPWDGPDKLGHDVEGVSTGGGWPWWDRYGTGLAMTGA
ncbi:hypothetical protein HPT29_017400 [Microvirga terrae]|uniref:Uncharacterized protein n=1 Tax=Microvirga terrae TaxID=2740529 RepID=A0ABY5RR58_9HYPH|nr:hypothetical protein [Microvirga terrae]UVF18277.1 hypothetical protein HPT29_017400 [Microvirga terrae]